MDFDRLIGFVDSKLLEHCQRHLRDVDVFILKGAQAKKTYEQIAEEHSYTHQYLQQDVGPKLWKLLSEVFGEKISKTNFQTILERHFLQFVQREKSSLEPLQGVEHPTATTQMIVSVPERFTDCWESVMDISIFYGRQDELNTLGQWLLKDRCRLVALLGMGGIGKTTLAVKLAELFHSEFEVVIWRSLRNAPTFEDSLNEWLQQLSNHTELLHFEPLERKVSHLINSLQQRRCLLFLDNFESVLQAGSHTGDYLPGYEGYGMLLRYVADVKHQSCIIITGREKPRGLAEREGPTLPVRSFSLKGLKATDIKAIFTDKGCQNLEDPQIQAVLEHYAGNPLALKIVAAALFELGGGDPKELVPLLQRGIFAFDDINDLLARHFNRLSGAERKIMYWLAINRDPIALAQLEADSPETPTQELLEALQSLSRRSLIEREDSRWFLQPVIQEYVTQRFVSGICEEIVSREWAMLRQYALLTAQNLDYIQDAQQRFILQPVLKDLQLNLGSMPAVIAHLKSCLTQFKADYAGETGYFAGNLFNLLRALNADLRGLDFSRLALWQSDFRQVSLQDVDLSNCDLSKSVFTPVLNATLAVAFSPNGQRFALGNADNYVRLWQVADYRELWIGKGHQSWVSAVAFSPDGQFLASGSFDHTIRLWTVATGECVGIFQGHTGWVWSVAFSPDGQSLISGSDDCTAKVWDVTTGICRQTLTEHKGWIWSTIFSPDGQIMATAGNDHHLRLWDVATGKCFKVLDGHQGWIRTVCFTDDGQQIMSGSDDATIRIWDIATGHCLQVLQGHRQAVKSLAYAPSLLSSGTDALSPLIEGEMIVSGSQDCTIRIWDTKTGRCLRVLGGGGNRIWSVALNPEGRILLSGSNDSTLNLWNPRTGQSLRTLQATCMGIKGIAYSPCGTLLASGGDDKVIRLWDAQSGRRLKVLNGHKGWVWDLAFSPDAQRLASASGDGTVGLWDVASGDCLHTFIGHLNLVFAVAFDPKGRWVASGSNDQTVKLWDIATGACLHTWQHQSQIWSVAFHPSGRYLATSGDHRGVHILDVISGEVLQVIGTPGAMVHSVSFSPDGRLLVSGRDDHTVEVWDWSQGVRHHQLNHQSRVWSVAFSADGEYLASGGFDHKVRIWQISTGDCAHALQGHEGEVWSVAFHPQQPWVVSGGQEGQVLFWDIVAGTLLQRLQDTRLYENLCLRGATGLSIAQQQSLQSLGAVMA